MFIFQGASNYPFRGTKGELFEGNNRVLTAVSGGVIERAQLGGQKRSEIMSNLDWTPTLLQFAGYLQCIDPADYSWDGQSQYDLIMNYEAMDDSAKRDHLMLNIGDSELQSASILIHHHETGTLYKYIRSNPSSPADRWIYSESTVDVWSTLDFGDTFDTVGDSSSSLQIKEYDPTEPLMRYSQRFGDEFLFDLTNDESELYNLLDPQCPNFNADLNMYIVNQSLAEMSHFMATNQLWSTPISLLHSRLEEGDPTLKFDGLFVRPFLSNKRYLILLKRMFLREQKQGIHHSTKQLELYLNSWTCPEPMEFVEVQSVQSQSDSDSENEGDIENEETLTESSDSANSNSVDIDSDGDTESDNGSTERPKWPVLGEVDTDSDSDSDEDIENFESADSDQIPDDIPNDVPDDIQDDESRAIWPVLGEVDSDSDSDDVQSAFDSESDESEGDIDEFVLEMSCGERWHDVVENEVMMITVPMANQGDITLDACASSMDIIDITAYDSNAGFLMGFAHSDCSLTVLGGKGGTDYIFAVYADDREDTEDVAGDVPYDFTVICSGEEDDGQISGEKSDDDSLISSNRNSDDMKSGSEDHDSFGHWNPDKDEDSVDTASSESETISDDDGRDERDLSEGDCQSVDDNRISKVYCPLAPEEEVCLTLPNCEWHGASESEITEMEGDEIADDESDVNEDSDDNEDKDDNENTEDRPLWPVLGQVDSGNDDDESNTAATSRDESAVEFDIVETVKPTSSPSAHPSSTPSMSPSKDPTSSPSNPSTDNPTSTPTHNPSLGPSSGPSLSPSVSPSLDPTKSPTLKPSISPSQNPTTTTTAPSPTPTIAPTPKPTDHPTTTTTAPSATPSIAPSHNPTTAPTQTPTTIAPTTSTATPSIAPSATPSAATDHPTSIPTKSPTASPSTRPPTASPTVYMTGSPTVTPSVGPTIVPSHDPSESPSGRPTFNPSAKPTNGPSVKATHHPTVVPSVVPTVYPTAMPTAIPTLNPSTSMMAALHNANDQDSNSLDESESNAVDSGDDDESAGDDIEEAPRWPVLGEQSDGDIDKDDVESADAVPEPDTDDLEQNSMDNGHHTDKSLDGGAVFLIILIILAVLCAVALCILYFCFREKYESIKEQIAECMANCKCWAPREAQYWIHDEYDLITDVEGPEEEGTGYGAVRRPQTL